MIQSACVDGLLGIRGYSAPVVRVSGVDSDNAQVSDYDQRNRLS